jgi:hypothetical protein
MIRLPTSCPDFLSFGKQPVPSESRKALYNSRLTNQQSSITGHRFSSALLAAVVASACDGRAAARFLFLFLALFTQHRFA